MDIIKVSACGLDNELKQDILMGLTKAHKALQSKYLYDEQGSELFNQITRHPDYYLTACELEILETHAESLLALIGKECVFNLIELGPGEGIKTDLLIKHFTSAGATFNYLPVDISEKYLQNFGMKLLEDYPDLPIMPIQGDYISGLGWLKKQVQGRNIVLFLGSSIGNFDMVNAQRFLRTLHGQLNPGDLLLIGFDLKKSISILLKAYDDNQGLTKSFNLNLLSRINKELNGNFDLETFYHHATYNVYTGAMESFLISLIPQMVTIDALQREIYFEAFEPIHIEYSYKYIPPQINNLSKTTGYKILAQFQDSKNYFLDSLWQVMSP